MMTPDKGFLSRSYAPGDDSTKKAVSTVNRGYLMCVCQSAVMTLLFTTGSDHIVVEHLDAAQARTKDRL
jgi:hypothetical protein